MNDKKAVDESKSVSEKLKVMGAGVFIGILFNYFFVWERIGVSAVLFNIAVIGSTIFIYPNSQIKKRLSYIFLVPIVLLCISYAVYNNEILRIINTAALVFLMPAYLFTIRYENIKEIDLSFLGKIFDKIIPDAIDAMLNIFPFMKEIIHTKKASDLNATQKNILKGLALSLPLLLIVIGLLSSADKVFASYIEDLGSIFTNLEIGSFMEHSMIIIFVALYMFGFLWSFQYENIENKNMNKNKSIQWEPVTIITIIFMINIVYLLFTIIQFSYLYVGMDHLPEGFNNASYAAYARRGFFELIFVTMINLMIVLTSMKFCKKDNIKINKIANVSYSLLILFTLNMLFSANYKMNLYEKAFGYTRLRLFVQSFMILIGLLLIIATFGIWLRRVPVLRLAVIAAMSVYIGLNFINVDKIIAKNNIERYKIDQKIDMNYLEGLSCDAVDEIGKLTEVKDPMVQMKAIRYVNKQVKKLNASYDHWYEYNYYKEKVLKNYQLKR